MYCYDMVEETLNYWCYVQLGYGIVVNKVLVLYTFVILKNFLTVMVFCIVETSYSRH